MQTNAHTEVQKARTEHKIRPGFYFDRPGYQSLLFRTCGCHCVVSVISGTVAVVLEVVVVALCPGLMMVGSLEARNSAAAPELQQ